MNISLEKRVEIYNILGINYIILILIPSDQMTLKLLSEVERNSSKCYKLHDVKM